MKLHSLTKLVLLELLNNIGLLLNEHAISYPLPPNVSRNNLYGSIFAHLARLLINVDELPNPQFLAKLNLVLKSYPIDELKICGFNFWIPLKIDNKLCEILSFFINEIISPLLSIE